MAFRMMNEGGARAPESSDGELERLRRLTAVDALLTALVGVLDVREAFARVSEIAGRVLGHDAIMVLVLTKDGERVVPYAIGGPGAPPDPGEHPLPDDARRLLIEPWEFEILDDLQADPAQPVPLLASGYQSLLRLPVRLQGRVAAILVFLSRARACYTPADVPVARRVAEHVALALSHHGLAEQARQNEESRARTATL